MPLRDKRDCITLALEEERSYLQHFMGNPEPRDPLMEQKILQIRRQIEVLRALRETRKQCLMHKKEMVETVKTELVQRVEGSNQKVVDSMASFNELMRVLGGDSLEADEAQLELLKLKIQRRKAAKEAEEERLKVEAENNSKRKVLAPDGGDEAPLAKAQKAKGKAKATAKSRASASTDVYVPPEVYSTEAYVPTEVYPTEAISPTEAAYSDGEGGS